jgi:hypothetical protein
MSAWRVGDHFRGRVVVRVRVREDGSPSWALEEQVVGRGLFFRMHGQQWLNLRREDDIIDALEGRDEPARVLAEASVVLDELGEQGLASRLHALAQELTPGGRGVSPSTDQEAE